MVRLIFMVVAFLMMIGGVVGGFYYWGIDPMERIDILIGKAPADPKYAAPTYVDFGILIVPVIQDREAKKRAEMILRLKVPFDKQEKVASSLPRLQAAFLQEMMGYLPLQLRDGQKLDHDAVSKRLVNVADKTLGKGLVFDVLIEQASVK